MTENTSGRTVSAVPQLLTYDQVADLLALPNGPRGVRSIVATGALPIVHVGRYPRVRADDLAAYIEARSTRTVPARIR